MFYDDEAIRIDKVMLLCFVYICSLGIGGSKREKLTGNFWD